MDDGAGAITDIVGMADLLRIATTAEPARATRLIDAIATTIIPAGAVCTLPDALALASEVVDAAVAADSRPAPVRATGGRLLARVAARFDVSTASRGGWRDPAGRLDALRRITHTATTSLGLSEMLDRVVQVVADVTVADAAAMFLYEEANDLLMVHAGFGIDPRTMGTVSIRSSDASVTARAAREQRPVVVGSGLSWGNDSALAALGNRGLQSQASFPLLLGSDCLRLVGVLSVYTREPREWDATDIEFFETVSGELAISIDNVRRYNQTTAQLERKVHELSLLQRLSREIASNLDSPSVLTSVVEAARELIHANAAALFTLEQRNGRLESAIDYRVGDVLQVRNPVERDDHVREVIETGVMIMRRAEYIEGEFDVLCLPLRSARMNFGALCVRLETTQNVTDDDRAVLQAFSDSAAIAMENAALYEEMRSGVARSQLLLQEMHHRVRNNLQTVAALLSLQMRQAENGREGNALREATSRIQAIAAVHDLLSDERRLGGATIAEIAKLVAEDAHAVIIPPGLKVAFVIEPSDLVVPSRTATIFALLINELVANAVRHGFVGREQGTIIVRSRADDNSAIVEVENDGDVIAAGFNPSYSKGLGMRIVNRLVSSDLRGVFSIAPADSGAGTVARIRFPLGNMAGKQG